jgi:hypothetical protein
VKSPFAPNPLLIFRCKYLSGAPGAPGTQIDESTLNWSAFARDSWQPRSNLTLDFGLRYEEQRLRYATFLQGRIDPTTGLRDGKNALVLDGLIAPRVGIVYDPTREGRAKVFAHWGRFYESIPTSLNDVAFGGAVNFVQQFAPGYCAELDPNTGVPDGVPCLGKGLRGDSEHLIGANGILVAPSSGAQYIDETVAGAEIAVMDDLRLGAVLEDRRQGRVLDDISTDGANTFVIGNPGEWSSRDDQRLQAELASASNPADQRRLANELAAFRGLRLYDKPVRIYDALQLTATRRFSQSLYLQSSYVYSRTVGNYPGALSPGIGDVLSNSSSQYALVELRANRSGPLPQDRPHMLKLNGYYALHLAQTVATLGVGFHVTSGAVENVYASNPTLGANQVYLLPRGSLGRTDYDHGLDLQASWRRVLGHRRTAEVFIDIFNVYDHQAVAAVDETYTPSVRPGFYAGATQLPQLLQNAAPVSGGSYADLIWLRLINAKGLETGIPVTRNPNFLQPTSRTTPRYVQVGLRFTF